MKEENKDYCVYQHVCPNGIYIGVTCNTKERWKPSNYKKNNTPFKDAIERFGWDAIKHEVIASGLTRYEAFILEGELIMKARENGTCLNANRSGYFRQTQTEAFKEEGRTRARVYREEHPEECKARHKAWRKKNPDYDKNWQKNKRKENPEECKAKQKVYNKTFRETNPDYHKNWREANKEKDNNSSKEKCNTRSKTSKEKDNARSKAFREANPNYMREWREAHPNYMREWRKRKKGGGDKT